VKKHLYILILLQKGQKARVGQHRTCAPYDCMYGSFPAKITVYTLYVRLYVGFLASSTANQKMRLDREGGEECRWLNRSACRQEEDDLPFFLSTSLSPAWVTQNKSKGGTCSLAEGNRRGRS